MRKTDWTSRRQVLSGALCMMAILLGVSAPAASLAQPRTSEKLSCNEENLYCLVDKIAVGSESLATLPTVRVVVPQPERVAPNGSKAVKTVTYVVETRGKIKASLTEFKAQANATLNDLRGWAAVGLNFKEVARGGDFTLVLSQAGMVPSFSPSGCDSTYSCNVGRYVIINEDRWLGATPSWNAADGSLRDYRHMVVNHETGHWLGHGHRTCSGAGQPAAVMQQQSINLGGCRFNPWPLPVERYAPRLGI